tara:strand:+ start:2478 stop:2912 length:435 start_codon:yes stop_codon:yes gene_type:complete
MKIAELFEEADYTSNDTMPDDSVPYKSKNQEGVLSLSPYTNDMGMVPGFKDVDGIASMIDKMIEQHNYRIGEVPVGQLLATQYWIDDSGYGMGDPVFPELTEYPVVAYLNDKYYHIIDGHHRISRAAKSRKHAIKAYVFNLRSS